MPNCASASGGAPSRRQRRVTRRTFLTTAGAAAAGAAGTTLLDAILSGQGTLYAATPASTSTVNIEVDAGQNENPFRWKAAEMRTKWGFGINLIGLPFVGQYEKLVSELTARSTAYDVLVFPPYFMGDFVSLNFLRDLDQFHGLGDPQLADYLPAYRDPVIKKNGKTYALMYDGDLLQVTYRRDLFDDPKEQAAFKNKYGHELAPPQTWDQYMQIAEFFHRPPNLYGTAFYAARGFCYAWFVNIFAGLGGKWFNPDLSPGINGDAGVRALTMLVKMKDYAPPNILQIDYPGLNAVFLNGSTAMVVQWDDLALKVENPAMSKVVGKGGYAPCPVRSYMPYSRVMAISAFSRNPENAYRLAWYMQLPAVSITYVYDPDCGQDPYRYSQLKPGAVKNHLGKPTMAPAAAKAYVDAIQAGLKAGYPELSIPGAPRYLDILDLYVNQALAGSLSPKAALDGAAREWAGITQAEDPGRQKAAYSAWVDSFHKAGIQY
jgi:multiple sugar transport system substrate-binding protein